MHPRASLPWGGRRRLEHPAPTQVGPDLVVIGLGAGLAIKGLPGCSVQLVLFALRARGNVQFSGAPGEREGHRAGHGATPKPLQKPFGWLGGRSGLAQAGADRGTWQGQDGGGNSLPLCPPPPPSQAQHRASKYPYRVLYPIASGVTPLICSSLRLHRQLPPILRSKGPVNLPPSSRYLAMSCSFWKTQSKGCVCLGQENAPGGKACELQTPSHALLGHCLCCHQLSPHVPQQRGYLGSAPDAVHEQGVERVAGGHLPLPDLLSRELPGQRPQQPQLLLRDPRGVYLYGQRVREEGREGGMLLSLSLLRQEVLSISRGKFQQPKEH